jgi:hypothetical protein
MSQPIVLYELLPTIYKQQDQQQDFALQNLFDIFQHEFNYLQEQIDTAYDNCFIETCEPWAEIHIGALLGIQDLDSTDAPPEQRVYISNTIQHRRHKGQVGALEQAIKNAIGWQASITEYQQLLSMMQHLQALRLDQGRTMNIRKISNVNALATQFEVNAHGVDVRLYPLYPAKFNLNNIGVFICRLNGYAISNGNPCQISNASGDVQGYTFSPIGLDMPLFHLPAPLNDSTTVNRQSTLSVPITRDSFAQDLVGYAANGTSIYYGNVPDVLSRHPAINQISITLPNNLLPIPTSKIVAADLRDWKAPTDFAVDQVAIDVASGRFMLGSSYQNPGHKKLRVSYNYGFSAPMGGGHYHQNKSAGGELIVPNSNTLYVSAWEFDYADHKIYTTLDEAINVWNNNDHYTTIQVLDDATYTLDPTTAISSLSRSPRICILQAALNARPCLQLSSPLSISNRTDNPTLEVTLNGLLIDGGISLGAKANLKMNHCTLLPKRNTVSLSTPEAKNDAKVTISHSIIGAVQLPKTMTLAISDSIMDAQGAVALSADWIPNGNGSPPAGPITSLQRVTVFGSVYVSEMVLLSESIITDVVKVDRIENGVVRFSYLPFNSQTPPRYLCQPDVDFIPLASQRAQEQGLSDYTQLKMLDQQWWDQTLAALRPRFTSTQYNNPGYAQLNLNLQQGVATGAANGAEIGCFQSLNQPYKQRQLLNILDKYLPLGLKPAVFYVN